MRYVSGDDTMMALPHVRTGLPIDPAAMPSDTRSHCRRDRLRG
ncbi:hypothetical protein PK69_11365 [Xanthomonas phaseoli pv. phaseoli]|uniref:Uncharacterized protein n=1 Tax=Xanthomonas campestris pv. phaseoli TaxID=317013 RepID=A0AB34QPQ9_XANCH|nr:hypothetical protein AC609_00375 [Xanthomonas phaseoli pv. phaseoli]AZU32494.1 hypothetical protein AC801_22910 [Xanthomonas sp. ISO98C4]AZU23973.1 hypothetical protein AC611_00375 [Xanthomonas phaseoli pv. phaseoli]AZU32741.1 hypothetical protein AC610_00375 [Xanthomonas phaseoli pv. phaseoli]KGT50414.1 hypothetical protein NZ02_14605 [Xanthomonas phaseoli pv. phaseoli]